MSPRRASAVLACAVSLAAATASAHEDGRETGRAMRGCGAQGSCHGVNPGASARIEGPMSLAPGARGDYTLVITSTRPDFAAGGCNIAAAGATLVPGAGTQSSGGEITHIAPVARSGAEVRIPFAVTAPAASGAAMVFAAANAVSGMRNSANDAWALTALAITVGSGPVDAGVTDAGVADAGVTDAGVTDAGPRVERYDPGASSVYGVCSASPGRARGGWAALALVGLLARRRRWS